MATEAPKPDPTPSPTATARSEPGTDPTPETDFGGVDEISLQAVIVALIPEYSTLSFSELVDTFGSKTTDLLFDQINSVYPGHNPSSIQLVLLLETDGTPYVGVGLNTKIEDWLSVRNVKGWVFNPMPELLPEIEWGGGLVITRQFESVTPTRATPDEILAGPEL